MKYLIKGRRIDKKDKGKAPCLGKTRGDSSCFHCSVSSSFPSSSLHDHSPISQSVSLAVPAGGLINSQFVNHNCTPDHHLINHYFLIINC